MHWLRINVAQEKLKILDNFSGLELEVAATIDFLCREGYGDQAVAEVKRRKPVKASDERIKRAQELLRHLEVA